MYLDRMDAQPPKFNFIILRGCTRSVTDIKKEKGENARWHARIRCSGHVLKLAASRQLST